MSMSPICIMKKENPFSTIKASQDFPDYLLLSNVCYGPLPQDL